MTERAAGVLLHPTSLPERLGLGTLGAPARRFVDWMVEAGLSLWQVLPLVPTGAGDSPYSSWSALAGNPDLVDLHELAAAGLLSKEDLEGCPAEGAAVDYGAARAWKMPRLAKAAHRLLEGPSHPWRRDHEELAQADWAREAALYQVLRQRHAGPWWRWPPALRRHEPAAVREAAQEHAREIAQAVAAQLFFERQWRDLRRYGEERGVQLVGDMPFYVDTDSADVWANQTQFLLNDEGRPPAVSGVPPDAFSATGQLWGNPLYRWDRMAQDGFAWWRLRLARALTQTHWVRIDHFRGFSAYWEVPAGAPDARGGRWVPGPGQALFEALHVPDLPILAEDLGVIDDPVRALLKATGFPGMLVLQFAFGADAQNLYLPHNHHTNRVVYTGTHDNPPTLAWWKSLDEHARHHVRTYFAVDGHDIVWNLIRAAFMSVARFAVVPMQDFLVLDAGARMNTPGRGEGNWRWRMQARDLTPHLAHRVRRLVELYGRG